MPFATLGVRRIKVGADALELRAHPVSATHEDARSGETWKVVLDEFKTRGINAGTVRSATVDKEFKLGTKSLRQAAMDTLRVMFAVTGSPRWSSAPFSRCQGHRADGTLAASTAVDRRCCFPWAITSTKTISWSRRRALATVSCPRPTG
jgi:hypothetical protein